MSLVIQRLMTIVIWGVIAVGGALIAWQLVVPATADAEQIAITPMVVDDPYVAPTPSATDTPQIIYISGAVITPGVYTFDVHMDVRIIDVVVRAGGLRDDADVAAINLAAPVGDAAHIHVLTTAPVVQSAQSTNPAVTATQIDINHATLEELGQLPGVGPALAQRIIDFREQNGPFTTLDDLDAVSGVGPALLSKIAQFVTLTK